ncbi:MAG: chemotaxis protein CheB [Saccharospirillum sp.]
MQWAQHNRIGIIAETPLVQHQLQKVIEESGYEVAVNTSPERLNPDWLSNETIRVWVVELEDHEAWEAFLHELLERAQAPILFGDASLPAKNDDDYGRWKRRMEAKLNELAPVVEPPKTAPVFDLNALPKRTEVPVYDLPESLRQAPKTELGPLWVLCASLGGPEAVKRFLDVLPGEIPASFLYAQHIDAGCLDALEQSVGRHTELTLCAADHGCQLENGHVYVVPVQHEIRFTGNHGIVWQNNPWSGPYGPSHDHLLNNVVKAFGRRAHAIVFSGMGSDGALGVSALAGAGGTVWAQSPDSCVQSSMPDSAERSGAVRWRDTPEALARRLIDWLSEQRTRVA